MRNLTLLAFGFLLAAIAQPARASVLNLGADLNPNGKKTVVPFYSESDDGRYLDGAASFIHFAVSGKGLQIVLDTAGAFGPGPLDAAELFIDAFDVDFFHLSEVYVQGVLIGSLADTASPSFIPLQGGPVGTHELNDNFDVDNTFLDLTPFLADLVSDSTFTIEIVNTTMGMLQRSAPFRIDGINIQASRAELDPSPEAVVIAHAPEPMTLAVWSGLACVGGLVLWRRRVVC